MLFGGWQVESWEGFEAGSWSGLGAPPPLCWVTSGRPVQIFAKKMGAAVLFLILGLAACSEARSTGNSNLQNPNPQQCSPLSSCEVSRVTLKRLSSLFPYAVLFLVVSVKTIFLLL